MIPAQDVLSPSDHTILQHELKLKPFRIEPIGRLYNPHSNLCSFEPDADWATNAAILAIGVAGRYIATKHRAPRALWSTVIIAVPLFSLYSVVKLDSLTEEYGHR